MRGPKGKRRAKVKREKIIDLLGLQPQSPGPHAKGE